MEERYRIDYMVKTKDWESIPNGGERETEFLYAADVDGDFSSPDLTLECWKDKEVQDIVSGGGCFDDYGDRVVIYNSFGKKILFLEDFRIRHEFYCDGEWMTAEEIEDYEKIVERRTLHVPDPLNN